MGDRLPVLQPHASWKIRYPAFCIPDADLDVFMFASKFIPSALQNVEDRKWSCTIIAEVFNKLPRHKDLLLKDLFASWIKTHTDNISAT